MADDSTSTGTSYGEEVRVAYSNLEEIDLQLSLERLHDVLAQFGIRTPDSLFDDLATDRDMRAASQIVLYPEKNAKDRSV